MKNITILGGTGGFGLWVFKYITQHFNNVNITITGTDIVKGNYIAKKYNVGFENDNIKAVKDKDIIIFCVPISLTEKIIKQTGKYINKNSIVLDVTSIKQLPVSAFKKYLDKNIVVIPTHPMFGPYIQSLSGQVIALTPSKKVKNLEVYKLLKNYLFNQGVNIIESSAKKHDKNMAIVQGLTHFNMFVTGKTIEKLGINIKGTLDYISPIYKILISSVSRYLHQNPGLYWDIQKYNTEVLHVDKVFKSASKQYYKLINSDNKDDFINNINLSQSYFGKNSEKGQIYTDKIIYLVSQQIDKIKNKLGKNIKIVNIYTGETVVGIIDKYKNEKVYINNIKYDINKWVLS